MGAGSGPDSIGFLPSPASGSLNGYAIIGRGQAVVGAPESPGFLDLSDGSPYSLGSAAGFLPSAPLFMGSAGVGAAPAGVAPNDLLFANAPMNGFIQDPILLNGFPGSDDFSVLADLRTSPQPDMGLIDFRTDMSPWETHDINLDSVVESSLSPSLASQSSSSKSSPSPMIEAGASGKAAVMPIRKVKNGKVEKAPTTSKAKKKKTTAAAAAAAMHNTASGQTDNFVVMTPTTINAHSGRPNPFECFEAMMSTSHKGRKGPLDNAIKENALQVRRLGACFCCHSRKVKCDKVRPCRNCKKLAGNVPQIVCWQFPDFLPVLFPKFMRSHLAKEEVARFISDNIQKFGVEGLERPTCTVELFSGTRFRTVLRIQGKFFTPKTTDVLQQWHLNSDRAGVDLQLRNAVPIGIDPEQQGRNGDGDGDGPKDDLKKKCKEYVAAILREPEYAEQLTETFLDTDVPRRILRIVNTYQTQTNSAIVRRAMNVYTLHYILTRHLCMTRRSVVDLRDTNLVPQGLVWVTPRLLNRQIKAVLDEMMQRESVETAADNFVVCDNEVKRREGQAPEFKRAEALRINDEIEKLPFRQFLYQFHQIYQTHSKDVFLLSFTDEQYVFDEDTFDAVLV
ncbi:unnamed protein product [Parascedosporium putredinis]|uniref:Zn(2)-C6 fungal-type domain-containing protein n=1 Tax=Parascedosporium putredinis TaxID=1442378 RepID=A0A9P1H9L5_9PEZI|nr:unnamed protein product [Parascedosporium putredinis]CAI8003169.1 unnamed protein product [Parascedosporium putredinis]